MNKYNHKKAGIAAIIVVILLLITGTFAWVSGTQRAFNPLWASGSTNYGGRIHDDFDGYGPGEHNKDIFAENFGEEDIFVRIRLSEFLMIEGEPATAMPTGAVINDPTTWARYVSLPNDAHARRPGTPIYDLTANYGLQWTLGHQDERTKYFMPTHNHATLQANEVDPSVPAPFISLETFRMTHATGEAVDAIAATGNYLNNFNVTNMTSASDFAYYGLQTGRGDGTHDYWDEAGIPHNAPLIYTDYDPETDPPFVTLRSAGNRVHYSQATLPVTITGVTDAALYAEIGETITNFSGLMTIANWNALDNPTGNFWILDVDGWFYWNGYLPAGEATSLLMDEIYAPDRRESWDHVIEVDGIFFTCDSINTPELDDMTNQARNIFTTCEEEEEGDEPGDEPQEQPTSWLPAYAVGCPQTGTADHIWEDSTGVEWCVVATEGSYSMLIARRVHQLPAQDGLTEHQANRHHYADIFVPWPASTAQAGGPEIRGRVNNWWDNNASPELRAAAVHTNLRNLNDTISSDQWNARNADTTMTSLPVAGSTNGLPFFLSPADVNVRLGSRLEDRQAQTVHGWYGWYWLSSAGLFPPPTEPTVSMVSNNGIWTVSSPFGYNMFGGGGVRPAIWVYHLQNDDRNDFCDFDCYQRRLVQLIHEAISLFENTLRSTDGTNVPVGRYWASERDFEIFHRSISVAIFAYDFPGIDLETLRYFVQFIDTRINDFEQARQRILN